MNRRLCALGLLGLCVGYASFLTWREANFRASLASPTTVATPVATPIPPASLDPSAILTVLGLSAGSTLLPSAEPLTLHASFVRGTGLSSALLADGQGSRMYRVGDQLPGGSVLRRVEVNQAVLWNKGREEVLTLQTPPTRFLRRYDSQTETQAPIPPARYLRPHTGQSE